MKEQLASIDSQTREKILSKKKGENTGMAKLSKERRAHITFKKKTFLITDRKHCWKVRNVK